MGLRDNLKNMIADQQRAADEAVEKAKQEADRRRARMLELTKASFLRILAEDAVQEIVGYHVKNVRGLRVVVLACYDDRAVIYLDPESNVPRQHPLNIEVDVDFAVAPAAIASDEVQAAIVALKHEGILVKAEPDTKTGAVRFSIDYRNL
ncbi:hypothetical protein [Agrobacterium pusense]|uniref:hypothetical protein n=1 Tax=Agrobacterium pusense TaxID=648995 RepID=UPI0022B8A00E|nr:hypothetical protein [Agrobacterium pusense]MCZ7929515.1 hypothetical protein [Agrobacterium pusense]